MVKTVPTPMTRDEMNLLINQTIGDDLAHTLFYVAKTTGKRLGELYNLKVKDILFDDKYMMIKILKRKRVVERETLLTDQACTLLKRWILNEKLQLEDYVFRRNKRNKESKGRGYRQIQNLVKEYGKKAGIDKNIMFHNFRHYFVTELTRQGMPYDKIQKLTGHASISTLNTYDSATAKDIEVEARKNIVNL